MRKVVSLIIVFITISLGSVVAAPSKKAPKLTPVKVTDPQFLSLAADYARLGSEINVQLHQVGKIDRTVSTADLADLQRAKYNAMAAWAQKHGYAGWNFDISKMELDPPKKGGK